MSAMGCVCVCTFPVCQRRLGRITVLTVNEATPTRALVYDLITNCMHPVFAKRVYYVHTCDMSVRISWFVDSRHETVRSLNFASYD